MITVQSNDQFTYFSITHKPKNREPSELRSLRKDNNYKPNPKSNQKQNLHQWMRIITRKTSEEDLHKPATAASHDRRDADSRIANTFRMSETFFSKTNIY